MAPQLRVVAAAACTAVLAAGCTAPAEQGDAAAARSAVGVMLHLCVKERAADVADVLTRPARDVFIKAATVADGCNAVLRLTDDPTFARTALEIARVTTVKIHGETADVGIEVPGHGSTTVEADRRGEAWSVTNDAFLPSAV